MNALPFVNYLGRHVLAEFFDCEEASLDNVAMIEQVMTEAAVFCGATVVSTSFHRFNPFGVSGVVVIAESHLAIHTWPEYRYAAVDFFTCGDTCDPMVAHEYVRDHLRAGRSEFTELQRGLFDPITQRLIPSGPVQGRSQWELQTVQAPVCKVGGVR